MAGNANARTSTYSALDFIRQLFFCAQALLNLGGLNECGEVCVRVCVCVSRGGFG